jgi:hypothetical protein
VRAVDDAVTHWCTEREEAHWRAFVALLSAHLAPLWQAADRVAPLGAIPGQEESHVAD